jgi:catechol 2,3-dioxygenase-like lactoylglutathione lyase family enzyme
MYERYISQLAHVQIVSPRIEATVDFFKNQLGLEESGRDGGSVFLRGWGEHFYHSLEIVEGKEPALGHIGWRAQGPGQLEEAAKRIEAAGAGLGWTDGNAGRGKSYRYRGPGGHEHHIFWDVKRFAPQGDLAPIFPVGRNATGRAAPPSARSITSRWRPRIPPATLNGTQSCSTTATWRKRSPIRRPGSESSLSLP